MLERFRQDVLELRPRAVVILAGTNDIAGNAGSISVETVQANLASMAELARVHRVKVVLASVLPVNDAATKEGKPLVRTVDRPPVTIGSLNRWIASYARTNGHVFLDYHAAMVDEGRLLRAELADDGLHPNGPGYALMAPLAESAIARALGTK
jgi:lysophospholipase L1-like esterase